MGPHILPTHAGQPMHWIYKMPDLEAVTAGLDEPEFLSPPANPFYRVDTGCQSPYGDALVVQLQSLAECKGVLCVTELVLMCCDI